MNPVRERSAVQPVRGSSSGPDPGTRRHGNRVSLPLCLSLALTMSGCATSDRVSSAKDIRETPVDRISYWAGDSVHGKPSVVISLAEQKAYFYKSQQLVGVSPVSTGKEGRSTPPGKFSIIERDIAHESTLFGDYVDDRGAVVKANVDVRKDPRPPGARFAGAPMPYFMRVAGGIGMHQGYLPGVPASHGCIRMPATMAEAFFNAAPLGTPVTIKSY